MAGGLADQNDTMAESTYGSTRSSVTQYLESLQRQLARATLTSNVNKTGGVVRDTSGKDSHIPHPGQDRAADINNVNTGHCQICG